MKSISAISPWKLPRTAIGPRMPAVSVCLPETFCVPLRIADSQWSESLCFRDMDTSASTWTPKGGKAQCPHRGNTKSVLEPLDAVVSADIKGRDVRIRAWRHSTTGVTGHSVPIYFLDADLSENSAPERALTDALYGGDDAYRLSQEAILGIGGIRLLRALGHNSIYRFHMNEGHSALLALALFEQEMAGR